MNKADRKRVSEIIELLEQAQVSLEELADAEREKYDNMPEGLQESERGVAIAEAADCLEEETVSVEEVVSNLSEYAE